MPQSHYPGNGPGGLRQRRVERKCKAGPCPALPGCFEVAAVTYTRRYYGGDTALGINDG